MKFPTEKAVKTYVDASATTSAAALNAEITRATAAELANANAITAEATTARAAELTNANAIAAEATTARATELANANAITAEATTARAAELTMPTQLQPKLQELQQPKPPKKTLPIKSIDGTFRFQFGREIPNRKSG